MNKLIVGSALLFALATSSSVLAQKRGGGSSFKPSAPAHGPAPFRGTPQPHPAPALPPQGGERGGERGGGERGGAPPAPARAAAHGTLQLKGVLPTYRHGDDHCRAHPPSVSPSVSPSGVGP